MGRFSPPASLTSTPAGGIFIHKPRKEKRPVEPVEVDMGRKNGSGPGVGAVASVKSAAEHAIDHYNGDRDLVAAIARIFLEDYQEPLSLIEAAMLAGDRRQLTLSAHRLKGAVGVFDCDPAFQATLALEAMGRSGNISQAKEGLETLRREVEILAVDLRTFLNSIDK